MDGCMHGRMDAGSTTIQEESKKFVDFLNNFYN